MTETEQFIGKLMSLQEGERSRLRRLAGCPLDETVPGFDLFAGLWWPLRQSSQRAPRRDTSWLIAKLYGAVPTPAVKQADTALAHILGNCEPRGTDAGLRFRARFDALLCSSLSGLEPHLCWALSVVADAVGRGMCAGLDWVRLLDDLSAWDRGDQHRHRADIRGMWACMYLQAAEGKGETGHVD